MPQQILGTMVQKTDDAVGIFRNDQEKKHWYVAVVNNRTLIPQHYNLTLFISS